MNEENIGDLSAMKQAGDCVMAVDNVKASVESVNSLQKSEVRLKNYPPLGVISHTNRQIFGHWMTAVCPVVCFSDSDRRVSRVSVVMTDSVCSRLSEGSVHSACTAIVRPRMEVSTAHSADRRAGSVGNYHSSRGAPSRDFSNDVYGSTIDAIGLVACLRCKLNRIWLVNDLAVLFLVGYLCALLFLGS